MRGSPLLRTVAVAVGLVLMGLVVGAVVRRPRLPPSPATTPTPPTPPTEVRVPTLLTITLSGPARTITLTEPSGRSIAIPVTGTLTLEHESELATRNHSWSARVHVDWQDPAPAHFLHLALEPDHLETRRLTLFFPPGTTRLRAAANWRPHTPPTPHH